jgi:hypothetical protein
MGKRPNVVLSKVGHQVVLGVVHTVAQCPVSTFETDQFGGRPVHEPVGDPSGWRTSAVAWA